jgi:hypothetical protein
MPPLELNDSEVSEMSMLLTLSAPIDQRLRSQFLQEVAQELEQSNRPARLARVRCTGWRARLGGAFSIRLSLAKASIGALRSLFA